MTNLTVPEVAAVLRCGTWSVKRLINAPGGIRASKVAGRWIVHESDLAAYQERQANRPRPRQRRKRAS